MKILRACFFLVSSILVHSECSVLGLSYDYSATTECLEEPERAHYGGGMLVNPEFNNGNEGWSVFGQGGVVEEGVSGNGNMFIVAHGRTHPLDSFSQTVRLEEGMIYSFSAWVQVSEGTETVTSMFKTSHGGLVHLGQVNAKNGCWSMLKGGVVANFSEHVDIIFESKNTSVDLWVDNVSLQPFTKQEWRSHQETSIDKIRKRKLKFISETGASRVSIKQVKPSFPFGLGINHNIINSTEYQNWFTSRFNVATFTNEMKWYSTEKKRGVEDYSNADAMMTLMKRAGILVRGHNIFWDNPKMQPDWVEALSGGELEEAAGRRIDSVVRRYAGELIGWDVMNENLHFRFFEDKLGENASAKYFSIACELDPDATMFLNEYNTIEYRKDEDASVHNYVNKIKEIMDFPGNTDMSLGIGVQGHFNSDQPNLAYMRSSLDMLASTGFPVWVTELDVAKCPNQAEYLEEILREAFAHPGIEGIVSFSGPESAGFKVMPLTDLSFKNTPAGDVIDKVIDEWRSKEIIEIGNVDDNKDVKSWEVSLFHGEYEVSVEHHGNKSVETMSVKVAKDMLLETEHVRFYLANSHYCSIEGVLYCRPHYDQLFKRTGSLDKSFEECIKIIRQVWWYHRKMFGMQQNVYPTEKVSVNGTCYHRRCFKCTRGRCTISPSNYVAHEGKLYCKHYHTQLFREKGNYSQLGKDALNASMEGFSRRLYGAWGVLY